MGNPGSVHRSAALDLLAAASHTPRRSLVDAVITAGDLAWLQTLASAFIEDLPSSEVARVLANASAGLSSWAAIESLLQMHRCATIAYQLLDQPDVRAACSPPEATMLWLRGRYLSALAQVAAERVTIARLLAALQAEGVPTLVIKGLAIGDWLYDDPALREHVDIDLIVPEARVAAVENILTGHGYERASGPFDHPQPFAGPPLHRDESLGTIAYRHRAGDPSIDISFDPLRLFWRPRSPQEDPFVGWWARRRVVVTGLEELPTLGPGDHFLQLSRHLAFHDYFRVVWFIDLMLLLRHHGDHLDWDLIGREARAHGIVGGIHRTLELLEHAYQAQIPPAAWQALRPNFVVRSLHRAVWPNDRSQPRDRRNSIGNPLDPRMVSPRGTRQILGLALLALDRNRMRNFSYLARRAFPPRAWLQSVYRHAVSPTSPYICLLLVHRRELARSRGTPSTAPPA